MGFRARALWSSMFIPHPASGPLGLSRVEAVGVELAFRLWAGLGPRGLPFDLGGELPPRPCLPTCGLSGRRVSRAGDWE